MTSLANFRNKLSAIKKESTNESAQRVPPITSAKPNAFGSSKATNDAKDSPKPFQAAAGRKENESDSAAEKPNNSRPKLAGFGQTKPANRSTSDNNSKPSGSRFGGTGSPSPSGSGDSSKPKPKLATDVGSKLDLLESNVGSNSLDEVEARIIRFDDEQPAVKPIRDLSILEEAKAALEVDGLEGPELKAARARVAQTEQFIESMDGVYDLIHDPELLSNVIGNLITELGSNKQYKRLLAPEDVRIWMRTMRESSNLAVIKKASKKRAPSRATKVSSAEDLLAGVDLGGIDLDGLD